MMGPKRNHEGGYTLMEVMISMLIMAIAFLSLIAVQLGALNGYISARDNSEATEIARRTAELLRVEGMQWQTGGLTAGTDVYTGTERPFDVATPLASLTGTWAPLVATPVDVRFNRTGIDADHLGGKFCIYAKANTMAGDGIDGAARQVLIAVVYPGPNATMITCNTTANQLNGQEPDGTESGGLANVLEIAGLRVVYYGTVVVRRSWAGT